MTAFQWKPQAGDSLAILFGAGAAHSHAIEESLRPPLAGQLMDVLLERAYPNDADRNQRFIETRLSRHTGSKDLTFDWVWQGLVQPPEAVVGGQSGEMMPSRRSMPTFYECIHSRLGQHRPIPKAYNILAEVLFSCPQLECLATTNFDELIDEAIHRVARLRQRIPLQDYRIASTLTQHHFLQQRPFQGPVLHKLHGTLSDPYSIIAGLNNLQTDEQPEVYHGFLSSLRRASHVIIAGYSFSDHSLSKFAAQAIKSSTDKHVYVVCGPDTQRVADLLREDCNASVAVYAAKDELADDFLDNFLQDLSKLTPQPDLSLRPEERRILTKGPAFLSVHNPNRFLSGSARSGSDENLTFPDPLYDSIVLPKKLRSVLAKLVDLGESQRLRRVLQLSYVQYRYPSATHTRFAHSLGVAHLVNRMIDLQSPKRTDDGDPLPEVAKTAAERKDSVIDALGTYGHRDLLLSALLHDAGHGPSGHTLDSLKEFMPDKERQGHEKTARQLLRAALERQGFADLKALLGDEGLPVDQLASIILGEHRLSPVISNGGLDLDRLDFILRDLACTGLRVDGVSAGKYVSDLLENLDDLLRAFRLVASPSSKEHPGYYYQLTTGVENRNDCPVFRMLTKLGTAYGELYDKVYFCWQNSCAQSLVTHALDRALASRRFHLVDILPLVDEQLFETLQNFDDPVVREFATLAKYRRLYDPVLKVSLKMPTKWLDPRPLERQLNGLYGKESSHNWLVAFRPSKSFEASLLDGDFFTKTQPVIQTLPFGKPTPARLHFFAWPGLDPDVRKLKSQVVTLLERMGIDLSEYTLVEAPFD
ncbi:MAG: hypothetical protein RLZZ162_3567 [Verrucomicrobiota bacterium]